uniref:Putative 3-oxo-Delta(4,5)-steroid 5-beta-reductase-like n=1 Tax=Davidia involucrata TaxID=16924 RepID=A0A5B7BY41_DAVIN
MAGLSLAKALKKTTAQGGQWKVYGGTRRPMPSWFPSSITDHYIAFDAMNYDDTMAKLCTAKSYDVRGAANLTCLLQKRILIPDGRSTIFLVILVVYRIGGDFSDFGCLQNHREELVKQRLTKLI